MWDYALASKLCLFYMERKKNKNFERLGKKRFQKLFGVSKIIINKEKLKKSSLVQDKGTWRKAVEP